MRAGRQALLAGRAALSIANTALKKYSSNPYENGAGNGNDVMFFGNGSTSLTTSAGKQRAVKELTKLMEKAVKKFEYEKAMVYKEQIKKIKNKLVQ